LRVNVYVMLCLLSPNDLGELIVAVSDNSTINIDNSTINIDIGIIIAISTI